MVAGENDSSSSAASRRATSAAGKALLLMTDAHYSSLPDCSRKWSGTNTAWSTVWRETAAARIAWALRLRADARLAAMRSAAMRGKYPASISARNRNPPVAEMKSRRLTVVTSGNGHLTGKRAEVAAQAS